MTSAPTILRLAFSNNEIASIASSQHLCQGFGRLTSRGSQEEYIELLKGDLPKDPNNLFDGIDTSWNRVKGGDKIEVLLKNVEANFDFRNPATHLNDLAKAYQLINDLEDEHWKTIKLKAISEIITACAGLYLEASARDASTHPGGSVQINFEAINRSKTKITLQNIQITPLKSTVNTGELLDYNSRKNYKQTINIPENTTYTSPYWLIEEGTNGIYKVTDEALIGKPETPRYLNAVFSLLINNVQIDIKKPIVHRYSKPDKGGIIQTL